MTRTGRRRAGAAALALAALLAAPAVAGGDAALGKRLYWEGIGADGEPIRGRTVGDVSVTGRQFSCVNCHRPSGFGTSEGGNYVPPITGPILFAKQEPNRNRMFKEFYQESQPTRFWTRVRQPRMRPAYDEAGLARALREGVDPGGHALAPIMPRYALSTADIANLTAFLKGLSVAIDPGVERDTIHFATVIGPEADPAERKAMRETMDVFVRWMNKDTEGDTSRPNFSPNYRSNFLDAYRYWKLHVWELEGAPETWPAQLAERYRARPVFAMVSGLVNGPWAPIADFCDAERLPCILPNSDLPRLGNARYGYSIHFNRGLTLEAQALALHLADAGTPPARILQRHAPGPRGRVPADAFAAAMARLMPGVAVETRALPDREMAADAQPGDVLVLWPQDPAAAVEALAADGSRADLIALPSTAMAQAQASLPAALQARTRITWPYERPGAYHPRQFRVRAWMHTRRLAVTHPRLQLQTYYALTLLQFGLQHAITDFYRDYVIEIIEHEAENELNPGTHPELALGPGQRFASKGAFIAMIAPEAKKGMRIVSPWIVP